MAYCMGEYDIAVIGAGHAGIEAALAAARLGCSAAVFTINVDWIGNMPCNPSIGGTAKGHLVREIDALGGEMGKAADDCLIQSKMLNRGKGPAVHSLRAQIDRRAYSGRMKWTLEREPGVHIRQAEICALDRCGEGWRLETRIGEEYRAKAVILATGTFLKGRIFIGEANYESGPDGMFAATELSRAIAGLGVRLRRFKTGTPARILKSSVDFAGLERHPGDDPVIPFSFETARELKNRVECHITWTNARTKRIILENIHRSPLYGGQITGVGPRYCPSLEDKIVRFADKERHQLFIEPCGLETEELYLQGASSSLPIDVQIQFLRTIAGLENVEIIRPAYAIEYDCCDSTQLDATLAFMDIPGLYGAGQFNGSSGYEEAAAQGLIAGINAALAVKGRAPFLLDRSTSYIGTLIDDLVTKGVNDPYRMMTSRSEYRMLLRQDNADERLTPRGREAGLVDTDRWTHYCRRREQKAEELARLKKTVIAPSESLNSLLVSRGTSPVASGARLEDLMKRPQLDYAVLQDLDEERPRLDPFVAEQVEVEIKYEGYLKRQQAAVDEMRRMEGRLLPQGTDYNAIRGLRKEAQEKLTAIRPASVGQASRIGGVSPADISVLLVWLSAEERKGTAEHD